MWLIVALLAYIAWLLWGILIQVRRMADYTQPTEPTLAHEADPRLAVLEELRRTMLRRGTA